MEIGWRSADNIKREKQMYTGNLQGLKKYSNSKWHRFCKHNHSVVTQIPPTGGFFFPHYEDSPPASNQLQILYLEQDSNEVQKVKALITH